jgi:hypothetical protein
MGLIMAFLAGFFFGGRAGSEGLDEIIEAAHAVAESPEFEGLLNALRAHASHALIDIGQRLDPGSDEPFSMQTILDRARNLVDGGDATESAF